MSAPVLRDETAPFAAEMLRALYDTSLDAMILIDDAGRLIDMNRAAITLTGRTREELTKLYIWELGGDVGEDPVARARYASFVSEGRREGEWAILRANGDIVVSEYRAVANIMPGVHLSVLRDVTARKAAEDRLHQAYDELRAVDERRSSLLSMISHDIRSPLSAIVGAADLLASEPTKPLQDVPRLTRIIKRNAAQLSVLASDLLTLAEIQGGELRIVGTELDLRTTLLDAVEADALLDVRGEVKTEVDLPETPVALFADGRRLFQVFTNLLSNARRFARHSIHVKLRDGGNDVLLELSDDGPGIPEAELASIWDPFSVAHADTRSQTGLGLWIVRRLVEAHRGRVSAANGESGGARFTVALVRNFRDGGRDNGSGTPRVDDRGPPR